MNNHFFFSYQHKNYQTVFKKLRKQIFWVIICIIILSSKSSASSPLKKTCHDRGGRGREAHSLYLLEKPWADRFVNLLNAFVSLVWNQSLLLRLPCFLRHPLWIWKQSYIPTWIILSHQKHNEMVLLSKTYHRNCNPQKWCLGISAVSWSLLYQICKELSNFLYNQGNGHRGIIWQIGLSIAEIISWPKKLIREKKHWSDRLVALELFSCMEVALQLILLLYILCCN